MRFILALARKYDWQSLIASCRACEGSINNVNNERIMNIFMVREPPYCADAHCGSIVLLLHTVDSQVCAV